MNLLTNLFVMNFKLFFFAFFAIFFMNCKESINYDKECSKIKEIKIINKTTNKYISDTSVITKATFFSEFCSILKQRIQIAQANVKSNFGYFVLKIIFNTGQSSEIDVIYTVYDGIIIHDSDGSYSKQDKMLEFVLRTVGEKNR